MTDPLLTVDQAAERLGTTARFPRRLIAERRIAFVKVGSHVRIKESVLAAYIEGNTPSSPYAVAGPATEGLPDGQQEGQATHVRRCAEAAFGTVPGSVSRPGRCHAARSRDVRHGPRR
ncbi:helix-turn-helix domain-containing protein [Streptomyces sp900116325]|uniref:helix-turn-helix domain-containing protein n=1 Tax=Streptomyces sp. 900116325 TaxID=3154295 RepID=UPI0033B9861C